MPKSNDIHFAQASQQPNQDGGAANEDGPRPSDPGVVYETQADQQRRTFAPDSSRTMLSTDSKALILALPIQMSTSFAGYEPGKS